MRRCAGRGKLAAVVDVPPLVVEATKKSGLVWVAVPGQLRSVAAWHVWREDSAYLVTGPGEQAVPGLAASASCDVTVRSTDKGSRVITWRATVSRVEPGSPEWADAVPGLLAARLNLTDAADAERRWASTATVLRLTPTGELPEVGPTLPTGSLAVPAPPSPGRTPTRVPFTLGWRRHRRPADR
jgi:hypothetical protein